MPVAAATAFQVSPATAAAPTPEAVTAVRGRAASISLLIVPRGEGGLETAWEQLGFGSPASTTRFGDRTRSTSMSEVVDRAWMELTNKPDWSPGTRAANLL